MFPADLWRGIALHRNFLHSRAGEFVLRCQAIWLYLRRLETLDRRPNGSNGKGVNFG